MIKNVNLDTSIYLLTYLLSKREMKKSKEEPAGNRKREPEDRKKEPCFRALHHNNRVIEGKREVKKEVRKEKKK